jgi:CRP/FNR family transcriptional regulator, cyclic AMP receptor protein
VYARRMAVLPLRAEVGLLDLDPDLGAGIGRQDWEIARRACRSLLVSIPAGRWDLPLSAGESHGLFGLVIVTGMVGREVRLHDRHLLELLGPGDVLQLPSSDDSSPRLSTGVILTAALDTRMIVLGRPFIGAAARWPSLLEAVGRRLEAQRERLAVQGLIAHMRRAEHRMLLILWHLADCWGIVTPDGIVLPLPLSHDIVGQLSASRRSTATLALSALEQTEKVKRLPDGSWLLTAQAERAVEIIADATDDGRSLGKLLATRLRSSETREHARALRAEARLARAARSHG